MLKQILDVEVLQLSWAFMLAMQVHCFVDVTACAVIDL
jgi:hypothetical protein